MQILQNNPNCCACILSTVPCSAHPQEASGAETEMDTFVGNVNVFMLFLENLRELIIVAQVWSNMLMLCPIILYPIPTMLTMLMLCFLPIEVFWNYCSGCSTSLETRDTRWCFLHLLDWLIELRGFSPLGLHPSGWGSFSITRGILPVRLVFQILGLRLGKTIDVFSTQISLRASFIIMESRQ